MLIFKKKRPQSPFSCSLWILRCASRPVDKHIWMWKNERVVTINLVKKSNRNQRFYYFRHSCRCKFRDFAELQCNDREMVSIVTSNYKPTYEERRLLKFTVFYGNQINLEDWAEEYPPLSSRFLLDWSFCFLLVWSENNTQEVWLSSVRISGSIERGRGTNSTQTFKYLSLKWSCIACTGC